MNSVNRPFFGRAWNITIDTQSGEKIVLASGPPSEALRVVVEIDTIAKMEVWNATIRIFNLSAATQSSLQANTTPDNAVWKLTQRITQGDRVSISLGYKSNFDADKNLVYQGHVLQPLWTRLNVVDSVVTLNCVVNLFLQTFNHVNVSVKANERPDGKYCTEREILDAVCKSAKQKINIEHIDPKADAALQAKKYPRGQSFFDRPMPIIRDLLKDNNLIGWLAPKGLNVRSMDADPSKPADFTYGAPASPSSATTPASTTSSSPVSRTLLGVPEQTQDGIAMRVLMDSRPKLADIVQLAPGTAIGGLRAQIGQLPPAPNQDLKYLVAGIRHVGDTRGKGEDWYTEIYGVTLGFFPAFLLGSNPAPHISKALVWAP